MPANVAHIVEETGRFFNKCACVKVTHTSALVRWAKSSPARKYTGGIHLFVGRCRAYGLSPEGGGSGAGTLGGWRKLHGQVELVSAMNGAGTPAERRRFDYRWGAGATRMHRMLNLVAGTGPLFTPAPLRVETCSVHPGSLRQG